MTRPLENTRIKLRAMEPEDLALLYGIENDATLWQVGTTTAPYSRFALKQHIAETDNDIFKTQQLRLVIELKETHEAAGLIDLFNFSPLDGRAEVGIALLESHRQQGIAAEALALLEDYAAHHLGIRLLTAWVLKNHNEASRALFLAAGYEETACLTAWKFHRGNYEDVAILCKTFSKY